MSELRTNRIVPRDGLPSGASGGIIQMVQTIKTDTFYNYITSSYVDVDCLHLLLRPAVRTRFSCGQLYVLAMVSQVPTIKFEVLRGSTVITTNNVFVRNASISETETYVIEILDSPSTTSATTYKVQGNVETNEIFVNRRNNLDTMGESTSLLWKSLDNRNKY